MDRCDRADVSIGRGRVDVHRADLPSWGKFEQQSGSCFKVLRLFPQAWEGVSVSRTYPLNSQCHDGEPSDSLISEYTLTPPRGPDSYQ